MKETFYFSHDYNARSDWKLVKVSMKHGMEWIWAYWCIIEMLYEEWWYLEIEEYERITFELRVSYDIVKSIVNNFWLFESDDKKFWSNSVLDRLKQRMDKSEKARISVQKRWDNKNKKDTIVLQTNNDSNTIKERKGKEIKEKESKTETDTIVSSQAIVISEKSDNRNLWTQRVIDIVKDQVEQEWFLYDNNKDERNRATIIAKRQSDWWSFIKDTPEEQEEDYIRKIISFSNQNEYTSKIRSCKDFHEKWKKVANAMKETNQEIQKKNFLHPNPLLRFTR